MAKGWYVSEMNTWDDAKKKQVLELYGKEGLTPNTYAYLTAQVNPQRADSSIVKTPVAKKPNYSGVYFLSDSDDMIMVSPTAKGDAGSAAKYSPVYSEGRMPIGHAGNLVINENGNATIYDYGRYGTGYGVVKGNKYGNVRKRNIGNIESLGLAKDGTIDIAALNNHLSKIWASGRQVHSGKGSASYDEAVNYWDALANNANRDKYSGFGNNCVSAAARAAQMGTIQTGTPGNEGFWVPRLGLSLIYSDLGVLGAELLASKHGKVGLNDLTSMAWSTVPKYAQYGIDAVRAVKNGFKSLIGMKEEGGILNYLDYIK